MLTVKLDATWKGDKVHLVVNALVDSGADTTIVPADLLPDPQDWGTLPPFPGLAGGGTGAGGGFDIRCFVGCSVEWRGIVFATDIAVAEPGKSVPILLGRNDFFRTFAVQFQWHKKPPIFHVKVP